MFKIIYPSQDATLYEGDPKVNTGLDEVLEIGKRLSAVGGNGGFSLSRSLIKFDTTEVSASLSKYNKSVNDCKFLLKLYTTHAKGLPSEYTIDANVVGQNWSNGTGFINYEFPIDTGCSWDRPESGSTSFWSSSVADVNSPVGSSFYITGSGKGGSWLYQQTPTSPTHEGTLLSESFSNRPSDLNIDVTDAVKLWVSGSDGYIVPNNGFILKFSDENESNDAVSGFIRFFSRESHTVYVPKLIMLFDQSSFETGSMSQIDLDSYAVHTTLKESYKDDEISKIRIYGRNKYPQKSATNLFPVQTVNYIPSSSLYSIIDAATDEVVIPYDKDYTKVSCDEKSNFINLDMSGLMPERYYRIEFKVVDGILEEYISDKFFFKVTR